MSLHLQVKVTPKASKTEVVGWEGEMLKVKVAAVPEKGAANSELEKFLGKLLGVGRTRVTVIRGETSRHKLLKIDNLEIKQLKRIIPCPK